MPDPVEIERRLGAARRELRERFLLGLAPPRFDPPDWQPRLQRFGAQLYPRGHEVVRLGLDQLEVNASLQRASGTRSHSNENGPGAFVPTRWGTSLNWSGAVIAATDGELFESVAASWVVPTPRLPEGESVAGREKGNAWQSSCWIGLDGYRGFSRGLPQIGTASVVDIEIDPNDPSRRVAKPYCYAWVQWWVRGKHFGEVRVERQSFPIEAGDRVHARLQVQPDRQSVWFRMTRERAGAVRLAMEVCWGAGTVTQKVEQDTVTLQPVTLLEEKEKPGAVDRSLAPAEGLHAVFCVERPLSLPEQDRPPALYPLPEIGEVPFTQAFAASRRPGSAVGREHDLSVARFIRMFERTDGGTRTRFLTAPRPIVPREEMLVVQR